MSKAKSRWSILRNAIVHKQLTVKNHDEFNDSIRCFTCYGLFNVFPLLADDKVMVESPREKINKNNWSTYSSQQLESNPVAIKNPVEDHVINLKVGVMYCLLFFFDDFICKTDLYSM